MSDFADDWRTARREHMADLLDGHVEPAETRMQRIDADPEGAFFELAEHLGYEIEPDEPEPETDYQSEYEADDADEGDYYEEPEWQQPSEPPTTEAVMDDFGTHLRSLEAGIG